MNTINKVIFLRRTRELFFLWTIRAQRVHTTSTPNNKWMNKKLTKEVKRYKNSKNTRSNSFSFPCVSSTTIRLNDFCWPQWTFVIVSNRFCAYRRLMAREPDTIHMNEQKKERKKGQRGKIEREFDKWERERETCVFIYESAASLWVNIDIRFCSNKARVRYSLSNSLSMKYYCFER